MSLRNAILTEITFRNMMERMYPWAGDEWPRSLRGQALHSSQPPYQIPELEDVELWYVFMDKQRKAMVQERLREKTSTRWMLTAKFCNKSPKELKSILVRIRKSPLRNCIQATSADESDTDESEASSSVLQDSDVSTTSEDDPKTSAQALAEDGLVEFKLKRRDIFKW